ncbi:MAG: YjbH domain-containing protein [Deltaproteobacteria bacterium]|nr:YjbH domain-containing protein [Deltaproteobacteria bacterium]
MPRKIHILPTSTVSSFLAILLFLCMPALAAPPVPFPGNNGQTGLWDMPNARILPDWHVRITFHDADPYRYWSGSIGILDRMEINGRITEITTLPGLPGQKYDRDKAIDVKFLLFKERDVLPAIALGATDIHGTGKFTSRYLALSKNIRWFDLTLGLGQGILAGVITRGHGKDSAREFLLSSDTTTRVFGGLEFHLTDRLSLVGEYSTYDYEELSGGRKEDWPVNVGIKYRLRDHFLASLSYQKGDEVSFGLGVNLPLEPEGMLPWRKEPLRRPPEKARLDAYLAGDEILAHIVADQVSRAGFKGVRAAVRKDSLWIEFENNRYLSNQKATGRVARIVDLVAPPRIGWIYLALAKDGLTLNVFKVHRRVLDAYLDYRMDEEGLWKTSRIVMGEGGLRQEFAGHGEPPAMKEAPRGHDKLGIRISPRIESLLNDPSGFFKTAANILTSVDYRPWKGGLLTGTLRANVYNNISTANVVQEAQPTRSDFVDYLQLEDLRITRLAFDQVFQLPGDLWARGAVGIFESAYMGVGAELFRFFWKGRLGLGLESEIVKKRDLDGGLSEREGFDNFKTAFLNIYYHLWPELGVDLGFKVGRFLGGDDGVRMEVSRTYKYFTLGAWLTVTDTDVFTADYNRGYRDKGIYFSMPLSIFFNSDIPGRITYRLRPWTRDPGATVAQPRFLYPMTDEGNSLWTEQKLGDLAK